jgi:DNA-binding NtrC family response regulator
MKSNNHRGQILIIEDDISVAEALERLLTSEEYGVELVRTAEEGISHVQAGDFDAVITDLQMPGMSGLEVIKRLHPLLPNLPIILMTGHHTTDVAIEAIKEGAYDYILKPIVNPKEFLLLIERAVASRALGSKAAPDVENRSSENEIIGRSQVMQRVFKEIGRIAAKPVTVLIRGETGTGKELVARALYQHSERAARPFIIVNCVAIPETLLESELFGHEAGAFTGAHSRKLGKFEQASEGTIFLDEIGDMNLATQAKLLRVLQEKTIRRVGGQETISVEVRVLAATHCDLEQAVQQKKFREDLYYRLNDAVIHLPSLRERREDIPDLVHYFLSREQENSSSPKPTITPEALRFLQYRSWLGNVRELRNVVHKALLLAHGFPIDLQISRAALEQATLAKAETGYLQAFVAELLERAESDGLTEAQAALTEWVERELYGQAVRLAEGDQTKVAAWLDVSRPTVRERLLHYGLHPAHEKTSASHGL